ncbi:MAG: chorismate mutase [Candidatus Bathyarchaeia archaeon]
MNLERIDALRNKIDEIDEKILLLLKERTEISRTIGRIKREHGVPIRDTQREKEKCGLIREKAAELGLNPEEVNAIFQKIIEMSIHTQQQT